MLLLVLQQQEQAGSILFLLALLVDCLALPVGVPAVEAIIVAIAAVAMYVMQCM